MTVFHSLVALSLVALCTVPARAVRADDDKPNSAELDRLYDTVEKLEQRIGELEAAKSTSASRAGATNWSERIRLSGSADLDYLHGQGGEYEIGRAHV